MKNKEKQDRTEYFEALDELFSRQHTPEELREINKILKKYGDRIPLQARYPDLPLILSTIVMFVSIVVLLLTR